MFAMESLPDTLTTRETAKLLNASVRTIQLWVEDGRLKAWKTPGGHRRVLRVSVEEMLANRRRVSSEGDQPYEVLLVEEDAELLAQLKVHLGQVLPKANIRVSSDGYDGLIRLGERRPDLLVIDSVMQGMDGLRLLKAIDRESNGQQMRVIILSDGSSAAVQAPEQLSRSARLLPKPMHLATFNALVLDCYAARQKGSS